MNRVDITGSGIQVSYDDHIGQDERVVINGVDLSAYIRQGGAELRVEGDRLQLLLDLVPSEGLHIELENVAAHRLFHRP